MARPKKTHDPFRWFDSSPEVIRLVVMMYVRYPLSLRNVEDLLFERGIDISRRCGCGGTGSVRCSPPRSGGNAFSGCGLTPTGDGASTRST